mgnify:CR=1 FL=1
MINLLPPKEKEQLFLERKKKLVIILGYIAIISLIYLALVLFSVKFYILEQMSFQKNILDTTEIKYQTSDFLSYSNLVKKYNTDLIKVDTFYKKQIYFTDIIKTILDIQRPDGLFFDDMSIKNNEKNNKIQITVSGISNTRDNLLAFRDNIKNNNKIENIYFPPNSWIKAKDINFYVTFEVLNDKK